MKPWSPHLYRERAKSKGIPQATIDEALRRAKRQQQHNVPVILSLKHLSVHTRADYTYLRRMIARWHSPYREFAIQKRGNRGYRIICVPEASLMQVQRWIHQHILKHQPVHPASSAYVAGSSPYRCAEQHCGCRWLLKVDIQQFFESISEVDVQKVFCSLGYDPLLSFEMARLTTKTRTATATRRRRKTLPYTSSTAPSRWRIHSEDRYKIALYRHWQMGHIPQGAPTSPMISNLIMRIVDKYISNLADDTGFVYTRYADDMIFSTNARQMTKRRTRELLHGVYGIIRSHGFRPKTTKTSLIPPGARKIVLGLLVDGDRPRLTKEFRRRLECHAYYISKYGYANHQMRRGFKSVLSLCLYIDGLLSYAESVDPVFARRIRIQLQNASDPR